MHKILKDINFTKNAWNNDKLTIKIKYFLKTGINHLLHCANKSTKLVNNKDGYEYSYIVKVVNLNNCIKLLLL